MSWAPPPPFWSKFDPILFAATSPYLTKNFPRGFCDISFLSIFIDLQTHPRTKENEQKQSTGPHLGGIFTRNVPNDISPGKKGPSFFQSLYYVPLKLLLTFYRIIVKWGEVISMWKLGLRRPKSPFDFYSGKHSDAVFFGLFGTRLWTQQLPIIRRGCRIWKFMALPIQRAISFWKILKIEKVMILQSLRFGSGGKKNPPTQKKSESKFTVFDCFGGLPLVCFQRPLTAKPFGMIK